MATKPILIRSGPGVKRDGTVFEGEFYIDSQWCRFQRGLPRKMGGFRSITDEVPQLARGINCMTANGMTYVHTGSENKITQYTLSGTSLSALTDRTPAAIVSSTDNLWQFEVMYDSVSASSRLIAHGPPNLTNIDNTTTGKIFYGVTTAGAVLTDTAVAEESGGICVAAPYLLKFGSNGHVAWSVANKPADFTNAGSGDAYITGQKIVRGIPMRGGGSGAAALLWSLDSLLRANYVGGTAIWAFDTVSTNSSVMSSQCIIEHDSIYYWIGTDRFLMFNGIVREIDNQMNFNDFFDNINMAYRQKVFAMKFPRWGEIWWCYPRGSNTECSHAIIYNVRENIWYDTELPTTRTVGVHNGIADLDLMIDATLTTSGYTMWDHENGVDQATGTDTQPVRSWFQTAEISMLTQQESADKSLRVARLEPDFVQSGDLQVVVLGRPNARSTEVSSEAFTIPDTATGPENETVPLKAVRRLMSFRFDSNTVGGDYQMGQTIAHVEPADGRVTS
jgi:hypothetical protein